MAGDAVQPRLERPVAPFEAPDRAVGLQEDVGGEVLGLFVGGDAGAEEAEHLRVVDVEELPPGPLLLVARGRDDIALHALHISDAGDRFCQDESSGGQLRLETFGTETPPRSLLSER